jgi:hypothetical protein
MNFFGPQRRKDRGLSAVTQGCPSSSVSAANMSPSCLRMGIAGKSKAAEIVDPGLRVAVVQALEHLRRDSGREVDMHRRDRFFGLLVSLLPSPPLHVTFRGCVAVSGRVRVVVRQVLLISLLASKGS